MEILVECVGYKDSKDRTYRLGDLVVNPSFGDVWLVEKHDSGQDIDCPYRLSQYCDKDNYYMDLDDPLGFIVLYSKNEEGYQELYDSCVEFSKEMREID